MSPNKCIISWSARAGTLSVCFLYFCGLSFSSYAPVTETVSQVYSLMTLPTVILHPNHDNPFSGAALSCAAVIYLDFICIAVQPILVWASMTELGCLWQNCPIMLPRCLRLFAPPFVLLVTSRHSRTVAGWCHPGVSVPSSPLWHAFFFFCYLSDIIFFSLWSTLWQTWLLKALYK